MLDGDPAPPTERGTAAPYFSAHFSLARWSISATAELFSFDLHFSVESESHSHSEQATTPTSAVKAFVAPRYQHNVSLPVGHVSAVTSVSRYCYRTQIISVYLLLPMSLVIGRKSFSLLPNLSVFVFFLSLGRKEAGLLCHVLFDQNDVTRVRSGYLSCRLSDLKLKFCGGLYG